LNLLRTTNTLNLQDFLEHFELTLLRILHPRYNRILAENWMGDTFSLEIIDNVSIFNTLIAFATTAMDAGAGFSGAVHRWTQMIDLGLSKGGRHVLNRETRINFNYC
jgi:hypothetical protein